MAAIIAILATIGLTIYQVIYLLDYRAEFHLKVGAKLPENALALGMGIRLFAWIVTDVLVAMLMYGKQDDRIGTNERMRKTGSILSSVNFLAWVAISYWSFVHIAQPLAM